MKSLKMKVLLIAIITLANSIALVAQQLDIDKLKGLDVRSIGPAGMSGRVTAIDVVVDQPDIIYGSLAPAIFDVQAITGLGWPE